jgi:hypothetical protein
MSQWQSLCLTLIILFSSALTAFPQASASGVEIQSGDVWLPPGDRMSSTFAAPQVGSSKGDLPTGDVWLSPDHQTIPSATAEEFHPGDATLATRKE